MPIIVLFIVYSSVKSNIILQDTDFLSLLMNRKGKFIFYFFVSFIEEVIFRGIIFGLLLQKCKNKYLSCVIAALIFTLLHICTYHSSNDYNDTVVLHCYWENTPKWRLIAYSLSLYTTPFSELCTHWKRAYKHAFTMHKNTFRLFPTHWNIHLDNV